MAKLIATKQFKKNGERFIAGYKVALPKVEMEKCGFKEGDNLEIIIKKGEVRILQK